MTLRFSFAHSDTAKNWHSSEDGLEICWNSQIFLCLFTLVSLINMYARLLKGANVILYDYQRLFGALDSKKLLISIVFCILDLLAFSAKINDSQRRQGVWVCRHTPLLDKQNSQYKFSLVYTCPTLPTVSSIKIKTLACARAK